MRKKRFTKGQIIQILQEVEAGIPVAEVCSKHNCSEQSFYRWKSKFAGTDSSEINRLREYERENAELKEMVADQALEISMLRDTRSRKW